MKIFLLSIAIAGLAACGSGTGAGDATPKDSQMVAEHVDPGTNFPAKAVQEDTLQTDASFMQHAVESGAELAALATLAVQKGAAPEVKKLAQKIAADQQSLQQAANTIKQRAAADSSANYTDSSKEELEKLSGKAFDKQWVEKMSLKYTALISRYRSEQEAARDKPLKQFVHTQLPILMDHQQQLEVWRNKLQ